MNEARDVRHADAEGVRGFLVGNRSVTVNVAAQKAFQGAKDLGFSRHSLFLLEAPGGAAQKQKCPLRVVERLRRKTVFGFENEARLCILPIQPDHLGAPATFFRTGSTVFGRNEVLEGGEQKRAKPSL